MAIYKIRKRNGSIDTFNREKIEQSIRKAIAAVGGKNFSHISVLTDSVIENLKSKMSTDLPDVEIVQDAIEETLIK